MRASQAPRSKIPTFSPLINSFSEICNIGKRTHHVSCIYSEGRPSNQLIQNLSQNKRFCRPRATLKIGWQAPGRGGDSRTGSSVHLQIPHPSHRFTKAVRLKFLFNSSWLGLALGHPWWSRNHEARGGQSVPCDLLESTLFQITFNCSASTWPGSNSARETLLSNFWGHLLSGMVLHHQRKLVLNFNLEQNKFYSPFIANETAYD